MWKKVDFIIYSFNVFIHSIASSYCNLRDNCLGCMTESGGVGLVQKRRELGNYEKCLSSKSIFLLCGVIKPEGCKNWGNRHMDNVSYKNPQCRIYRAETLNGQSSEIELLQGKEMRQQLIYRFPWKCCPSKFLKKRESVRFVSCIGFFLTKIKFSVSYQYILTGLTKSLIAFPSSEISFYS